MNVNIFTPEADYNTALIQLINVLGQQFAPEQIYCFAKLIQQEELQSVFSAHVLQEQCIYYLLMITENATVTSKKVQQFIDELGAELKVVILVHEQEMLLKKYNQPNGFFMRVLSQGELCYGAPGFKYVQQPKLLNTKKQLGSAIVFWHKRMEMANGFLIAAAQAMDNCQQEICLFLLHHVIEQTCLGLIYVFMNYKAESYSLKHLLYLCACFAKSTLQHFLGCTENEQLLKIIIENYCQTGFQADQDIEIKSVFQFVDLTESFLDLAKSLCEAHFKVLQITVDEQKI